MTPLERAARALCIKDGLDPDRKFKSSDYSEDTAPHEFAWHEYLPHARAVLQAIREPSEETPEQIAERILPDYVVSGVPASGAFEADRSSIRSQIAGAIRRERAMIDAALEEG